MSKLLPCPFCGGDSVSFRSTPDMDTDGKFHCVSCNECGAKSREKFAMDACPIFYEELRNAWNTRPAPASTYTGLETVAYRYRHVDYVNWTYSESKYPRPDIRNEELVTRPQAEAIIAAKDAKLKEATDCVEQLVREGKSLRADNAELTARIKELEADLMCAKASRDSWKMTHEESFFRLEAKIADAEKDMATVYAWLREPDWSNRNFNLVRWAGRRPSPASFAKAYDDRERAVLGGKPS